MSHGSPSPRNTLTELEPVTLPIALSALSLFCAAYMEAKVSGREVPRATNVIAVTSGSRPITHPKRVANSATTAVMKPIKQSETKKASQPPQIRGGGMIAKKS